MPSPLGVDYEVAYGSLAGIVEADPIEESVHQDPSSVQTFKDLVKTYRQIAPSDVGLPCLPEI
jgi:hypothetical protein